MTEEQKETLRLLIAAVQATQDREIDAADGVILCQLAADLLEKIIPLVRNHRLSWLIKAAIYGARSALVEASMYFESLNNDS